MRNKSSLVFELMALGIAMGAQLPSIEPRERDQQPRKFTDARKAAADEKRRRKAAKRLKDNTP